MKTKKFDRSKIMKRAWVLVRDRAYGYLDFSAALADAWAEAKGEVTVLDPHAPEPVVRARPLGMAAWSAREAVRAGKRHLRELAGDYASGGH